MAKKEENSLAGWSEIIQKQGEQSAEKRKQQSFVLASRTFELVAPSTWTDEDAENFMDMMYDDVVWEKMEEFLQQKLRDFKSHPASTSNKPVSDVVIRIKD